MRTSLSLVRYGTFALAVVGVTALCGAKLLNATATMMPNEASTAQNSPLIQAWLDRGKDEAEHAQRRKAAEAVEAKRVAALRYIVPVVAATERNDDAAVKRQHAQRKLRQTLASNAVDQGIVSSYAPAEAQPQRGYPAEFQRWRERPSF